jgi:hypothetical protein
VNRSSDPQGATDSQRSKDHDLVSGGQRTLRVADSILVVEGGCQAPSERERLRDIGGARVVLQEVEVVARLEGQLVLQRGGGGGRRAGVLPREGHVHTGQRRRAGGLLKQVVAQLCKRRRRAAESLRSDGESLGGRKGSKD